MMFKPMLAASIEDMSKLKYPLLASFKYDGIRAMAQDGKIVSRKLKLIPNKAVQEFYKDLPEGIDGELLSGKPTDKNAMQATSTVVMSRSKPAADVVFYVFDIFDSKLGFSDRLKKAVDVMAKSGIEQYYVVHQQLIRNETELLAYEQIALDQGYEGLICRSIDGPYKQGRATEKQGWLLKLKRFIDAEAEILSIYEEMENTNVATKDALGHTERSSHKAGLVGKNTLGGFEVRGINGDFKDVEFKVPGNTTDELQKKYWKARSSLPGKIIKYKYFPIGVKDKPRLPIFLGFRDKRDM